MLETGSPRCSSLALHGSLPLLVAASARQEVSVWDRQRKQRLNAFANGNCAGSRISAMLLLPGSASLSGLLLLASSAGCLRVWRRWDEPGLQSLQCAWQAHDRPATSELRDARVALAWQPQRGLLAVAGAGAPSLRVWDVRHERCAQLLPLGLPEGHTACAVAASEHDGLLAAGCTDGTVRRFDLRLPSPRVVEVVEVSGSRAPIVSLGLQQRAGQPLRLAAASARGEIAVWDPRRGVAALHAVGNADGNRSGLSAMALHGHAPLLASGSRHQFIKLFDLSALRDGGGGAARETHTIRYFDGFLGARIGPVSALCFHPSKTMLAVGATDSVLSLFGTPSR